MTIPAIEHCSRDFLNDVQNIAIGWKMIQPAARREQLKEALVAAAERAIAQEGVAGVKARPLADEVGCAVGAIYNVVADLDELVLLANARTLAALHAALAAAIAPDGQGPDWAIEQLNRLALAYLDFAAAHRRQWQALFDHRLAAGRNPPDWYPLLRAAKYLGVPPWDLLDRPAFWQRIALDAEWAEGQAADERRTNSR